MKGMREEEVSCRLPKNLKEKRPLTGDVTKCSLRHRLEQSTSCPMRLSLCLMSSLEYYGWLNGEKICRAVQNDYMIAIATLSDWRKTLAAIFQPMRT